MLATRMRMSSGGASWALVDNALSPSTNNNTYTVNGVNFGDAASNRYLILLVTGHDARSEDSYSFSATIGGVSATLVASQIITDGSDAVHTGIYIANVPTGTSGTIVHTLSSYGGTFDDYAYSLFRVTGLVSSTPTATDTDSGNVNLTVPTNGFAVMGYASHTGTCSDWTGGSVVNIQKGGRYAAHAYDITPGGPNEYNPSQSGTKTGATWTLSGPIS